RVLPNPRTGAEAVKYAVNVLGYRWINIVGRTAGDVRDVMIEGESGLLSVFAEWERPLYEPSKRRVTFRNGAVANTYSADEPDQMRGPQSDFVWGDEVAAQRMESFKGQVNSLMGSVQALMITALTPFMNNVLRPIVTMLINATNAVRAFAEENERLTQFIVTLISIFIVLGPVITLAGQAMIIFGGALGVVLSPIGLVVAGLGGIVYMMRDRLPGAVDTARRVMSGLSHLFRFFFHDLQNFGLQEAILSLFGRGNTIEGQESVLEGMFFNMGFSRERAIELTQDIWIVFATWFNRIANLFNRVSNAVSPAFREISTFVRNNIGRLSQFAGMVFTLARNFMMLTNPVGQVMFALNAFGVDVFDVFAGVMSRITTFFSRLNDGVGVAEALQSAFGDSSFFNVLLDGFNYIATFITGRVMPALSSLRMWFLQTAMPRITNFINTTALPAIRSFFGILQAVWARVGPALTQFGGWFWNDLIPAVRTLVTEGFIPYWQSVIGLFVGLWSTVAPHLLAFADWFLETGLPAIQTFISDTFLPADLFLRTN
ncbi:MAG: terminase family protein, partial [Chloroflexota bacterium]